MLRNILASTAVVALISTGAIAETATSKADMSGNEAMSSGIYEFQMDTLSETSTKGFLASNMIGKAVMAGDGEDADQIGDINDVVVDRDGSVRAVIVGVGGFIGLGEKDVAVDFDRLSFVSSKEGRLTVVSDVSKTELEDAPGYERPDNIPDWMSMSAGREKMGELRDSAEDAYETVEKETIDPARERIDEMADSDWTAEKTQIDTATVSTDALIGGSVYTTADTNIGDVSEVLLDKDGKAEAVVIDVGGFLGFGEKPVAVSYDSLKMYEAENGTLLITATFTEEQLENAKTYSPADYKSDPDSVLLKG
ncbi:PRC-barrel domain-containing protein [Stappia sp. ES.058]|uniref:PRC-barrel domain-containing protein n=1 Tax=Stappia sp. ES.058 TaxID=1881061 RepID=UPI00087A02A1|nr:PRC-barrel domain-containing protein [Stappia sp. ES.058]SDU32345.1 PRC-barrel domain-containing protein [Stappia sp. ES.058]